MMSSSLFNMAAPPQVIQQHAEQRDPLRKQPSNSRTKVLRPKTVKMGDSDIPDNKPVKPAWDGSNIGLMQTMILMKPYLYNVDKFPN